MYEQDGNYPPKQSRHQVHNLGYIGDPNYH